MWNRLRMEWCLLRASQGYWGGLLLVGFLTSLAFQVGWWRVKQQENLHQRFLSERNELLTVIQAAVAEKNKELENQSVPEQDRAGMMLEPPSVEFDAVLNRTVSPVERNQFGRLWNSAKTPSGMAYLSTSFKVWKPPAPTGAISVGESDQWPEFYLPQLSSGGRSPVPSVARTLSASRIVNPFHVSMGAFDLSTLVVVIVPLIIIALTYDILSHDREQGILRLLVSQNQSVLPLMITRLVFRTLGVVGVLVSVMLASYFAVGAGLSTATTWKLLGMFSLAVTAYALFWASLAWGISSLGCSSTTNVVLLAVIWMVLVFVMPLSVTRSVARAHTVPPAGALATKEKEIQKSIQEMQAQQRLEAREMHGETTPESRMAQIARLQEVAQKGAEKLQDAMKIEVEHYYQQHQQREAALRQWQILSPALAIQHACDLISGNSQSQFVNFTRKVSKDHLDYLAYFQTIRDSRGRLTPADLEKMPFFPLNSPDPNPLQGSLWRSVATVVLWGVVVGLLGWSMLHFHPRSV